MLIVKLRNIQMALGSLHRAARWVVLPPSSNFFTPFRAPTALLRISFLFKAFLAVRCLTLNCPRHSLVKSPINQEITAEKRKFTGNKANGFLTSSSKKYSRQTDQAPRISLCPQCTHVRHRLCFPFREWLHYSVGMLSPTIITTSATTPPPESTTHPSPPHTCGVTRGPGRRNGAYRYHQPCQPCSLENTVIIARYLPTETVQRRKITALLRVLWLQRNPWRVPGFSEDSVLAPETSLFLYAGSSSDRTS